MHDPSDLTILQAAEKLRVFPELVVTWVERGYLPHAYALPAIAGIRIPHTDVEALRQRGVPGPPRQRGEIANPAQEGNSDQTQDTAS